MRAEAMQHWPPDWHRSGAEGGLKAVRSLVAEGGAVLLSGACRGSFVGPRVLAACFNGEGVTNQQGTQRLLGLLADAQDSTCASLPLMRHFLGSEPLSSPGFFGRLLGKKLPLPRHAKWSPDPLASLLPAVAYQASLDHWAPERRREAHHTVALPGTTCLLPHADYVALRENTEAWFCVPFDAFQQALGAEFRWIDEYTAVVSTPTGSTWDALLAKLAPAAIARVPHQEGYSMTAQQVLALGPPSASLAAH